MIRAVCFDLDDTLLVDGGLDAAIDAACLEAVSKEPGLSRELLLKANREIFETYWEDASERVLLGGMSAAEFSREVWRRTLLACGCGDATLAGLAFETFAAKVLESYRLYDDALEALESLSNRVPIALITNGPYDMQREKLAAVGIERHFQAVLISGEMGVCKPDASIFQSAADLLGTEPAATLHVGDSEVADVAGALGAGFGAAVWLNRHGRERAASQTAHYEIRSLSELARLVDH